MKKTSNLLFLFILIQLLFISCSDDEAGMPKGSYYVDVQVKGKLEYSFSQGYVTVSEDGGSCKKEFWQEDDGSINRWIYTMKNTSIFSYSFSPALIKRDNSNKDSLCIELKGFFNSIQVIDTTCVLYSISQYEYDKGKRTPVFEIFLEGDHLVNN